MSGWAATYLVDRGEINVILDGIALKLSVVVHNRLDVGVVERNGLKLAIDGLAIPCCAQLQAPKRAAYLSSMAKLCDSVHLTTMLQLSRDE